MKAIYRKAAGKYDISLTRKEAEALAYASTQYDILLTALKTWPDSDDFHYYGNVYEVAHDLEKACSGSTKTQRCPKCGRIYSGYPALSRADNKTLICPDCGTQEAIASFVQSVTRDKTAD